MEAQGENFTNRVELTDGDYLGTMSVWHSLHCLERLRKVIHIDYYRDKIPDYDPDHGMWTKEHSGKLIMTKCRLLLTWTARSLYRTSPGRHHVPPKYSRIYTSMGRDIYAAGRV